VLRVLLFENGQGLRTVPQSGVVWCSVVLCGSVLPCVEIWEMAKGYALCHGMLGCVAVCWSVLQCMQYVAECCNVTMAQACAVCHSVLQCVALWCCLVLCVAVCCSVLQCVAVCCSVLQCVAVWCCLVLCVALCCCIGAVCRSVLQRGVVSQCVAVCCSVATHCNTRHDLSIS